MVQPRSIAAIATAHAVGNVLLLHSTLFPLLEEDSFTMAHMDPSVIIGIPFPLEKLCRFVAWSLTWTLLVALACRTITQHDNLQMRASDGRLTGAVRLLLMVGISTVLVHSIIILCGIHPTMCPAHTLLSAFYVAFNMLIPVILFAPMDMGGKTQPQYTYQRDSLVGEVLFKFKGVCNYIFGPSLAIEEPKKELIAHQQQKNQQRLRLFHQCTVLGTAIGMVSCAILRILDHGMQVQRYPISIIVGFTWGSCGGSLIGTATMAVPGFS